MRGLDAKRIIRQNKKNYFFAVPCSHLSDTHVGINVSAQIALYPTLGAIVITVSPQTALIANALSPQNASRCPPFFESSDGFKFFCVIYLHPLCYTMLDR